MVMNPELSREQIHIKRLSPELVEEYFQFTKACGYNWCYCTAWSCQNWNEFSKRTAIENLRIRETMFAMGHFDGYLIYRGNVAIGWVQVNPLRTMRRLLDDYGFRDHQDDWGITCWAVDDNEQKKGVATQTIQIIIDDLKSQGIKRVFAFPFRREHDFWSGPESLYQKAGFSVFRDDDQDPILVKDLT